MNDILFKIFGEMSDGIIATDAEGKVLFINPCAEALTGWRLEQAKGQPTNCPSLWTEFRRGRTRIATL